MSETASSQSSRNSTVGGVSGGTLLAIVANQLPDSNPIKPFLIYLAPSSAIILTGLWDWARISIGVYSEKRRTRRKEQEFERYFEKARTHLVMMLEDPELSNQQKKEYHKRLEQLNLEKFNRLMQALRFTAPDEGKDESNIQDRSLPLSSESAK